MSSSRECSDFTLYFTAKECECHCGCGLNNVVPALIKMLGETRELANMPLRITSGSRCKKHNEAVGGKADSAHLTGLAADIGIDNSNKRYEVVMAAIAAGFNRIGIGSGLVHLDIDDTKPPHVLWVYR